MSVVEVPIGRFGYRVYATPAGIAPTLIVPGDPRRVGLIFSIMAGEDASLSVSEGGDPALLLGSQNSIDRMELTFSDHGDLVTAPWWASQLLVGGNVSTVEIFAVG